MTPIRIGNATLYIGDCIEVMRTLPSNSVDSIVTDPPYHYTSQSRGPHSGHPTTPQGRARIGDKGFMGQEWDGGDIAFRIETWAEALRILKPGGHMLAFGGTRTQHRMVCAIEDAGFEIRDRVLYLRGEEEIEEHYPVWLYGSGFPKSLDVAKAISKVATANPGVAEQWQGCGTALKPAHEPICVARKPMAEWAWVGGHQDVGHVCQIEPGSVTEKNRLCLCGAKRILRKKTVAKNVLAHGVGNLNIDACRVPLNGDYKSKANGRPSLTRLGDNYDRAASNIADTVGRWPANVILDGSPEVLALFPRSSVTGKRSARSKSASVNGTTWLNDNHQSIEYTDYGSAARYFYCAKASKSDRNDGLEDPGPQFKHGSTLRDAENLGGDRKGNHHPCVKPVDLMSYLCRLVTPPGGVVLDIFMGSGSTGKGAVREGFKFIGIDQSAEYIDIARRRIQHEYTKIEAAKALPPEPQLDLFSEAA